MVKDKLIKYKDKDYLVCMDTQASIGVYLGENKYTYSSYPFDKSCSLIENAKNAVMMYEDEHFNNKEINELKDWDGIML